MQITEIQKRLDVLVGGMLAKAVLQPSAEFTVRSEAQPHVYLKWETKKNGRLSFDGFKFCYGATPDECFAKAAEYVAALPTPEKARMDAFMGSLAETIELGKKADIPVENVNPLIALMKRLSKNALTHEAALSLTQA